MDEDIYKEEKGCYDVMDDSLIKTIGTAALVWFYFNDEDTSAMIANNYSFYNNYDEIRDNIDLENFINVFDVDIDNNNNSIMKTESGVYGICVFIGQDSD